MLSIYDKSWLCVKTSMAFVMIIYILGTVPSDMCFYIDQLCMSSSWATFTSVIGFVGEIRVVPFLPH